MNHISTAEKFFENLFDTNDCYIDYDTNGLNTIKQSMIEFAKLHVEAALKEASEHSYTNCDEGGELGTVNEDSILNAYPLTNIK